MARLRFPHPMTLLVSCILLAAGLTYVLPAGEYQRRADPATGRDVVVAGTYETVERSPVNLFEALVAVPQGLIDAADVVFLVFLVGASFTVVDQTGVLGRGMDSLVRRLSGRTMAVIPLVSALAAVGGVLMQMQEEFIALIPAVLVLTRRIGFDALVGVAMTLGAAAVGAAFSPLNPFQVGIAQKLAELPLLSGWAFRTTFLVIALAIWVSGTMRYARRTRVAAEVVGERAEGVVTRRDALILLLVLGTFALYVFGLLRLEWGFNEMSAVFFAMGVVVGLIGRLGIGGTVDAYVDGFRAMAFAGLLIGFARAVYIVLDQGHVVDTIVNALVTPIQTLPLAFSALAMMITHLLLHVPVPSTSGQAVLTMPVLVPVSDLVGLSRQVTVLAYQYGAGLCELVTPTNGALMAVLIAAGVPYERWLRFIAPVFAGLFLLGMIAVGVGIAIGLQ
ncbi:MAG: YfcC family protein [Gemmatimonadetes bacterium]|nr:YfcC family protein [Gemmatimonadota bacterium]